MFQISVDKHARLFLSLAFGCLAVFCLLVTFVLVGLLVVMMRGGGAGEEEGSLVGEEEDGEMDQPNTNVGYFKSTLRIKKYSFLDIFCVNCKVMQERFITVDT